MSTIPLLASYQIHLIGRDALLNQILKVSHYGRPTLVYLEGEGGVGKTAVLRELQLQARGISLTYILDMYHLEYQTPYGFAAGLAELLSNQRIPMGEFRTFFDAMQQARDSHDNTAEQANWEKAQQALVRALNEVSRTTPLWIMLDTVEVVALYLSRYASKRTQDNIAEWLPKLFSQITGSVIWVMAGRPSDLKNYMFNNLPKHFAKSIHESLGNLDKDSCKQYLEKTAKLVEDKKDARGASRIRDYLEEWGYESLYAQTQGKPLRLAIVADILRTGSSLPSGFYSRDPKTTPLYERNLDKALVEHIQTLVSPLGTILQTMSGLRKGVDATLLASAMNLTVEEAHKNLKEAENLALVKKRPGDVPRPYFLHDEIYDLFAKYKPIPHERRLEVAAKVREYYDNRILEQRTLLAQFPNLRARHANLWNLARIENMHYALWYYGMEGYAHYFALMSDAMSTDDMVIQSLIHLELDRTMQQMRTFSPMPVDMELYVKWDQEIRSAEIDIEEGQLAEAEEQLSKPIPSDLPPFIQAYWQFVNSTLTIKQRQSSTRTGLLNKNPSYFLVNALRFIQQVDDEGIKLAKDTLLANIHNYAGYEARLRGEYQRALEHYKEATSRTRKLHLSSLSGMLVNQAYAMSVLGLDRRAESTVREAVEIAVETNDVRGQTRALNVMSWVILRTGRPAHSFDIAQKAYNLLQKGRPNPRLEGLVLINLATARRTEWGQSVSENIKDWKNEWTRLLPDGLAYLEGTDFVREKLELPSNAVIVSIPQGTIEILKERDNESWVVALNESGTLWREVAVVLKERNEADTARYKTAMTLAILRLQQAAGLVRPSETDKWQAQIQAQAQLAGGSPYWPLMAFINLGFHYFYQRTDTDLQRVFDVTEHIIGSNYLWPPAIHQADAESLRWVVLGKMEMLRSSIAFRNYKEKKGELYPAIRSAALSLEYNYLVGQTSYDVKRAENGLEKNLSTILDWENELLPQVYEIVGKQIEPELRPNLSDGKMPRILRWLDERFGGYDLWKK
jgi:tetratricopeptide (TPR) repeat protein